MSKATQEQIDLSKGVDKVLLEIIQNGRTSIIIDKEGNESTVKTQPSAADINAAIKRLQMCGVSVDAGAKGKPDIAKLMEQLGKRKGGGNIRFPGNMPPVSEEDDAATA